MSLFARPQPNWVDSENAVERYLRVPPWLKDPVFMNGRHIGRRVLQVMTKKIESNGKVYQQKIWIFRFQPLGSRNLESMPAGSTAPDFYHPNWKIAVEVKNKYFPSALISSILGGKQGTAFKNDKPKQGQIGGRYIGIPQGSRQWLFVETRARPVGNLSEFAAWLRSRLGGRTIFEYIYFITEGESMVRY